MKLTYSTHIRISKEHNDFLSEVAIKLGFRKTDLIRFILNRGIKQLKQDSIEAEGIENLEITIKH